MPGLVVLLLAVLGCSLSTSPPPAPVRPEDTSLAVLGFPPPSTERVPDDEARALQGVLDGAVSDWQVSHFGGARGLTAALVTGSGAWSGAAGEDGRGERLEPDAMMAVDDITKTVVAAEVMRLVEAGSVHLDTSLASYVHHPLLRNGATVRQVLSMRSGLSGSPLAAAVPGQEADPQHPWTIRETLAHLRTRVGVPGGGPVYADANFLLLGLLVEQQTGRPLAQVERQDLFTPTGLRRVAAQDTERPIPPVAVAPVAEDGYLPSWAWAHVGQDAAGGLAADAATVARWGYQLYGDRLVSSASVEAMTHPPSQATVFPGIGYGLGTEVFGGLGTDLAIGHLGSDPFYSTMLAVVPARHLAAAVLVPQGRRDVEQIMRDLLEAAG